MTKYLFDDFNNTSPKAWKQKIQVDLKGADYNDTLLWKSEENITVKPFYTKEDQTHQIINLPQNEFNICQSIFIDDEKIANQLALDSLKRGATSIEFIAKKTFSIKAILKKIDTHSTKIYFKLLFLNPEFVNKISDKINPEQCFFNIDPIGNLAETGNWFYNLKEDQKQLKNIISTNKNCIAINACLYQNAGANCTQQIAYALAHANEYLNLYGENAIDKIHFNFSISSNYFFEIAKLRAFRILWSALLKEYDRENITAHIFTQPSLRNKTLYDYNVNMLRTTSECMSAILGGSDTITNIASDHIFQKSNEFGERIARNQLLILKEETELNKPQNIANGSYYIESITQQLSENALDIFKLIEKGGGFLKQLKEGIIQKKIIESAEKEQTLFDQGEKKLVGTNSYLNKKDTIKNNLELFPFVKTRVIKTLIQPITQKRLAEKNEQERLNNE